MLWILYTIGSSLAFVASNLTDKILLNHIKQPFTISAVGSLIGGLIGIFTILLYYTPRPAIEIICALIVGILGFLAVFIYLVAMRQEEASRIVPLWSFTDVLVPLLAFVLLREPLTLPIIGAILLILAGSLLLESNFGRKAFTKKRSLVILMLLASLAWSISLILVRVFVREDETVLFWGWSMVGTMIGGICTLPFFFRSIAKDFQKKITLPGVMITTVTEAVGILFRFLALSVAFAAPVQIVGTATQYFFVFVGTFFLSRWFPRLLSEQVTNLTIQIKLVALVLILGGIVLAAQ